MVIIMNNKVLIKLIVPEIDCSFDIEIPVNEVVWKIKEIMVKSINDLTGLSLSEASTYMLINKDTAKIYNNNEVIYQTDIRNATELILISITQ